MNGRADRAPERGSEPPVRLRSTTDAQFEPVVAALLAAGDEEPFSLAVTSSVSGEGVTSVSVGVATALAANTSRSVLLLDANLRHPTLHERLGQPPQPGLHECVVADHRAGSSGSHHSAAEPFRTKALNLWLMPAGAVMADPARLTTSDAAKSVVRGLRHRFDYVVIDCPPILQAVDAVPVCRLANAALLVVRSGITPREQVRRARAMLQGVPVMGAVLNGV